LSGVFEVKPFPDQLKIRTLIDASTPSNDLTDVSKREHSLLVRSDAIGHKPPTVIDVRRLQAQLDAVDTKALKQRKQLYDRLYHEAMIIGDRSKGISFTNMLLLIAHYKLIDDNNALRLVLVVFAYKQCLTVYYVVIIPFSLRDVIQRRAEKERVEDLVSIDRVRGLLMTIYYRQKFISRNPGRYSRTHTKGNLVSPVLVTSDKQSQVPIVPAIVVEGDAEPSSLSS
jgi:voltage-dependent calcium channel